MSRSKSKSVAIPEHLSQRFREGVFICIAAISLFLVLALVTYHRADPGWSHTAAGDHIANAGGRAGAWFADVILYVFGYLAYLFPLMMVYSTWGWVREEQRQHDANYILFIARAVGFIFILAAGCGLASLEMPHLHAHLPFTAGGILGNVIGLGLANVFNVMGAALLLLALFLSGVTFFTGLSWLTIIDGTGQLILDTANFSMQVYDALRDRFNQPKPKDIKPPKAKHIVAVAPKEKLVPKIEAKIETIQPSKRYEKERQVSLFDPADATTLPSLNLLDPPEKSNNKGYSNTKLESMAKEVEENLLDFGVEVQVVAVHPGPVITRFELQPAAGVKASKISSLSKDLARSLSVTSVRVVEVIPGKSVVGLELPNVHREMVRLSEVLSSKQYDQSRSALSMGLGVDIAGHPVIVDLAKMPHLLVAGTTGSGKSVGLNAMLISLLYKATPAEVRMILVDPKMLELSVYEGIPHLLTPVVTDMKEAANALRWCVAEMERRYKLMAALGVRNIAGFNKKVKDALESGTPIKDPFWIPIDGVEHPELEALPLILVLIDEFADMMMVVGKKVEQLIARIAQKARAAGIHLILATQRPSVDVITGLIKANIPTRIAFQVSSKIDSRTIIDQQGADQLLGHGDMLYLPPGSGVPVRIHGAFVDDPEVHRVVADWKRRGQPNYINEIVEPPSEGIDGVFAAEGDDGERDEFYDHAIEFVTETRKVSISSIQRKFKIGYNRAARLVEEMENAGVVSRAEGNGLREVLAPSPPKN